MNERDNFLRKIAEQKEGIQKQKDQQVADKLHQELDELARKNEVLRDPRFQKMISLAESPELKAALEAYSEEFGSSVEDKINDKTITIQSNLAKHNNRPVGEIAVTVSLGFQVDHGSNGEDSWEDLNAYFSPLCITWLDKDEECKITRNGSDKGGTTSKEGINAKAGLVILWEGRAKYSHLNSHYPTGLMKTFDNEEDLFNHIAHEIAENQLRRQKS